MPDISHYWQHARARPLRQAGGGSGRLKTQNGGGSSVQISTMVEIMARLPSPDNRIANGRSPKSGIG
jgi:hypothetical protein